ncbi:LysE family translocator [uncultured Oxalicibacterium sp.]|uniref:LysE family translocator n=1 Tax=uncultured Oxalicibacterium sp. TaxID=1168540 RepID=UPI0025E7297D|nr:LysE family translocator [uncultured Oxalicibacterium sp.]
MTTLLPFLLFAFVSSITPGPNNILLTSSGIRFGFLRSIPHMFGVIAGFGVMLALCATGVGNLVMAMPSADFLLRVVGSGYLIYLAWQLRNMRADGQDEGGSQPMSFGAAALFQFANPKAWIMGITGAAAFLPPLQPAWLAVGVFCLLFSAVNLPCLGVWVATGAVLRRYLRQERWRRLFCALMIVATLYAAVSIWLR